MCAKQPTNCDAGRSDTGFEKLPAKQRFPIGMLVRSSTAWAERAYMPPLAYMYHFLLISIPSWELCRGLYHELLALSCAFVPVRMAPKYPAPSACHCGIARASLSTLHTTLQCQHVAMVYEHAWYWQVRKTSASF